MKKVLYILIAAISVMAFSGCGMKNTVQIGTGDVNGTYYAYGTELAEILNNNSDVYFKVRKTAGSAANLRLISQEYVDIAFVQSDIMKDAYNGTGYFDKEYKGYSAIAGLYTEAIQVAVPKDSDINSISDLYGKSVSLGEKESGVLQNSKQILSAYGLNESMVDAKYLSYTDAAKAMKNGNLDAFFCTAGTPTRAITEISDDIKLIPIDGTVADRLTEQYNGYVKHTIKANTYDGQTEDIKTLGVKMVLIASDKMSDDRVKSITKNIFDNSNKFGFAKDDTFDMNFATENITIPFHKGASEYYAENGVNVATK